MDIDDITSADFSLENMLDSVANLTNTIDAPSDSSTYYYFGLAILSFMAATFFIYKFYITKEKHVTFNEQDMPVEADCEEHGFCKR